MLRNIFCRQSLLNEKTEITKKCFGFRKSSILDSKLNMYISDYKLKTIY